MFTSRFMHLPHLGPDDGATSGGDGSTNDANAGGQQGGSGAQQSQPFAVFPDERTFMSRVNREAKSKQEARAKELGFESAEAMEQALADYRQQQDQARSEVDRLKEAATKADNERKAALQRANSRIVSAEARVQATALGIKPERVSAALKLADLSQVTVDEQGEPDGAAIKAALEAVLADLPELKGAPASIGGGSNPAHTSEGLTPEKFQRLSYQERVDLYNRDQALYERLAQGGP